MYLVDTGNQENTNFLFVINNPVHGWQHGVFTVSVGADTTFRFLSVSKVNIKEDIIEAARPILEALDVIKSEEDILSNTPPIKKLKLYVRADYNHFAYQRGLDFLHADSESKGVKLSEYFKENFVLKTHLYDIKKNSFIIQKIDYSQLNPWDESILGTDLTAYKPIINDILFEHKKDTLLFKQVKNYIETQSPLTRYKNIMLIGPPATGKTSLARAIARDMDLPFAKISCNPRMEVEDIGGKLSLKPESEGAAWHLFLTKVLKVLQVPGVVVLDEGNNLTPSTQLGLADVLDGEDREIDFHGHTYKVHPNAIVFFCANKMTEGTKYINEAFEDRFYTLYVGPPEMSDIVTFYEKVFPLPKETLEAYVKMCLAIDRHMEDAHKHDNIGSPDRPRFSLRSMERLLPLLNEEKNFRSTLTGFLRGLFNGPAYGDSTVENTLMKLHKEVEDLRIKLFSATPKTQGGFELDKEAFASAITGSLSKPSLEEAISVQQHIEPEGSGMDVLLKARKLVKDEEEK